jgi:hypothetical protein
VSAPALGAFLTETERERAKARAVRERARLDERIQFAAEAWRHLRDAVVLLDLAGMPVEEHIVEVFLPDALSRLDDLVEAYTAALVPHLVAA